MLEREHLSEAKWSEPQWSRLQWSGWVFAVPWQVALPVWRHLLTGEGPAARQVFIPAEDGGRAERQQLPVWRLLWPCRAEQAADRIWRQWVLHLHIWPMDWHHTLKHTHTHTPLRHTHTSHTAYLWNNFDVTGAVVYKRSDYCVIGLWTALRDDKNWRRYLQHWLRAVGLHHAIVQLCGGLFCFFQRTRLDSTSDR